MFARQAERLTAGDEDPQARQEGQQFLDEAHAVREDVLTGVEDQQQPFALGPFGDHLGDRPCRPVGEPQRLHDGEAHQAGGVQRGELHQPDAVRVRAVDPAGGLQGEPGLADPSDTDDAHQPAHPGTRIQLSLQSAEFLQPSDETPRL